MQLHLLNKSSPLNVIIPREARRAASDRGSQVPRRLRCQKPGIYNGSMSRGMWKVRFNRHTTENQIVRVRAAEAVEG